MRFMGKEMNMAQWDRAAGFCRGRISTMLGKGKTKSEVEQMIAEAIGMKGSQ